MNQVSEPLGLSCLVLNADKELLFVLRTAYLSDVKEGAVGELLDEGGVGLQVVKNIFVATDDKIKFCIHSYSDSR